jgi:hypothetical protein
MGRRLMSGACDVHTSAEAANLPLPPRSAAPAAPPDTPDRDTISGSRGFCGGASWPVIAMFQISSMRAAFLAGPTCLENPVSQELGVLGDGFYLRASFQLGDLDK